MISWIFLIVGIFLLVTGLLAKIEKTENYNKDDMARAKAILVFVAFPSFMLLSWLTA